ncbi:TetR/AcrR family transcriptional regulator [Caminibacter pacificus]|uniref:TetR/AcrR family transcriptional regulator n=1 Tax=Caminibacter pacificus TaxID=1424653 RepID=A0ABX5TKZ2_9BACT|nr:TetR/AcrR family transcriptional regulator [Campylobacterota bacterium]QCI28649.1 TetR/AcrR family transcriptional regulator [Caminibacter pacificus]
MKVSKEAKKEQIMKTALELFAKKGFYTTTIADIAREMGMSVGNMYNYFPSKESLAKELLIYTSKKFGDEIRKINDMDISSKEKIKKIVELYFKMAKTEPELVDYFMRVYLSNKEIFNNGCEGMLCVSAFVTEIMIFFEEGVRKKELKNQDFFAAFGLFMGYIGGLAFLNREGILGKDLDEYIEPVSENIYNALKA